MREPTPKRPPRRVFGPKHDPNVLDTRQAIFVRHFLTNGGKGAEAYRTAYQKQNVHNATAGMYAKKLLALPSVKKAINDATEAAVEATNTQLSEAGARYAVSKSYIIERLSHLAFSDVRNYIAWHPKKGISIRDSDLLTDAQSFAIVEVRETITAKGKKAIRIKLADKRLAIVDLAKIAGFLNVDILDGKGDDDPNLQEARKQARNRLIESLERLSRPGVITVDAAKDIEFVVEKENTTPK